MKAVRFNTPTIAKSEIIAAFDTTPVVWETDRIQEIGQLIYDISGGFSRRRLQRIGMHYIITGALQDLARGMYDHQTTASACSWLNAVIVGNDGIWDVNWYPNGIDIVNPNDNDTVAVFFADTERLDKIAKGDLAMLTDFYLQYRRDWQACQELQHEYFLLTGKYYGGYPVM